MLRRLRLVDDTAPRPMKGAHMRLAFATHDKAHVDAHFASAKTFLFYDVGPDSHSFIEAVQFGVVSSVDSHEHCHIYHS